jgi:hypothetical protein
MSDGGAPLTNKIIEVYRADTYWMPFPLSSTSNSFNQLFSSIDSWKMDGANRHRHAAAVNGHISARKRYVQVSIVVSTRSKEFFGEGFL